MTVVKKSKRRGDDKEIRVMTMVRINNWRE